MKLYSRYSYKNTCIIYFMMHLIVNSLVSFDQYSFFLFFLLPSCMICLEVLTKQSVHCSSESKTSSVLCCLALLYL